MQNYTKSQTRLAFVQYIFQNEFLDADFLEGIEDFQKHFYDTNIAIIDDLNDFININRKFEKWDSILKSIIFAIITELKITDKNKFKIVLNDYLNISKSLVSEKETKLINAIIQKYIDKDEINKK